MVTIHCPLCDHNNNKRFISLGNRLFPVNISICRECGFVFQNPRFSEEQWENYYNTDYDTYHRPVLLSGKAATEPDHAAREIDRRLQKLHITAAQSMLDIGAGRGDILNYFMTNNPGTLKLFAIEPSHASQPGLEARGIKVIGSSINQFVDGPPGAMNLIVLRHVIEHLYDPLASLRIITGFMNEESSSVGELHPHALPNPDVNLSAHPAPIDQPEGSEASCQWAKSAGCWPLMRLSQ